MYKTAQERSSNFSAPVRVCVFVELLVTYALDVYALVAIRREKLVRAPRPAPWSCARAKLVVDILELSQ